MTRQVNFFPHNWNEKSMQVYTRRNLDLADAYTQALPKSPAKDFCQIPLALAHATLDVLNIGQPKLTRNAVVGIIEQLTANK